MVLLTGLKFCCGVSREFPEFEEVFLLAEKQKFLLPISVRQDAQVEVLVTSPIELAS